MISWKRGVSCAGWDAAVLLPLCRRDRALRRACALPYTSPAAWRQAAEATSMAQGRSDADARIKAAVQAACAAAQASSTAGHERRVNGDGWSSEGQGSGMQLQRKASAVSNISDAVRTNMLAEKRY